MSKDWISETLPQFEKDGFSYSKTRYTFFNWKVLKAWKNDLISKGFCHQLNVQKNGEKTWIVEWIEKKKI